MTALFDLSFLKTGNLSNPPDLSILVPQKMRGMALSFSGCAHKGGEFSDPLESMWGKKIKKCVVSLSVLGLVWL